MSWVLAELAMADDLDGGTGESSDSSLVGRGEGVAPARRLMAGSSEEAEWLFISSGSCSSSGDD